MENLKPEPEPEPSFHGGSDICQQLTDRYGKSSAPQHRHLVATAAAMRSILTADALPLSPPAYFAAAISSAEPSAAENSPHDSAATAALLTFLSIVLPLVPPRGIDPDKAAEAAGVVAGLVSDSLGASGARAGVKSLGALVGFCDLEDWDSVRLGFEALMKFSVDKRPKVRKCSQECLEKAFKSINDSAVIKEASKLVMTMLKNYMPLAAELSTLGTSLASKDDSNSEPNNVEVLHVLNMLKLVIPFLSVKTRSKVLSELNKLLKSQFSALTRHVFKTIGACFEASKADVIVIVTEKILVSLSSYVKLGDENPSNTVVSATTLLKCSLDILRDGESSSYSKNRPLVFQSVSGLLTSEASIASQAAATLNELINNHVDSKSLSVEIEGTENTEASVVDSICIVLEDGLMNSGGQPNEYILDVISTLFLKLGGVSCHYMKSILLTLADAMALASGDKYNINHIENCIGSAVIAMGPEKILTYISISLDVDDITCINSWLIPILKNYVVGASLDHYIQHILRLAKSFREASRQVKKTPNGRNLQNNAQALWGLLPSFCRYPTDLYQNVGPLSEVFIKFLKKDSLMYENVAVSLQVLVNQNRNAIDKKTDVCESRFFEVRGSPIESANLPAYSKKIATKNIKALASYSAELLETLTDLFIDSAPAKRSFLRDAIGCLAYITDSSITKKILMLLFERFGLINDKGEFGDNQEDLTTEEQGNTNAMEKAADICVVMELASALVGGAKEDLIDLIYNFIKHIFKDTGDSSQQQAYQTLSRVLEEHAWFFSSRSIEIIDLLLGSKPRIEETDTLRSRFSCFHPLMVHLLKLDSEEENAKAFLIVNEIILTLKDSKEEETRKVAYDVLVKISSSLRETLSSDSSDTPYQKLITMIGLSFWRIASKSGVSALSVLIYSDPSISLSVPDIIPTLISLLQGRSLELIKAALGSVKVLVSCLQARDLQNVLSNIVKGVLPWSSVSRNHFRSKVTIIMEILIRKCGISAVESITPDKYTSFVKSVVESRQNKNSKHTADGDTEMKNKEKPTFRHEKRKRGASNDVSEKSGAVKHRKRMDKNNFARKFGSKESNIATDDSGAKSNFRARKSVKENFTKGRQSESNRQGQGGPNWKNSDKGPQSSHKKKMNMGPKDRAFKKPAGGSGFGKQRKVGRK